MTGCRLLLASGEVGCRAGCRAAAAHTRHSFRRSVPPSPAMTDAYLSGHKVVPTIEAMLSSLKDTQPENPYAAMVSAGHRRYSC